MTSSTQQSSELALVRVDKMALRRATKLIKYNLRECVDVHYGLLKPSGLGNWKKKTLKRKVELFAQAFRPEYVRAQTL